MKALEEHDSLGAEEFASRHGFPRERDYVLLRGGQTYGTTAILGAAHLAATGTALTERDFASKDTAARILRELGFRVTAADDPEAVVPVTGTWRETSEVGPEASRDAWALAGREALVETSRRYRATLTPKELALEMQRRSGIRTKQVPHLWLAEVLGRIALDAAAREEPNLASLCVDEAGHVGEGYAVAVRAVTGSRPEDPDGHAAHERLACYRHFEAVGLPAGGGSVAALLAATPRERTRATTSSRTPRQAAPRRAPARPSRPTKPADRPPAICPTCFMALPATGVCDYCS